MVWAHTVIGDLKLNPGSDIAFGEMYTVDQRAALHRACLVRGLRCNAVELAHCAYRGGEPGSFRISMPAVGTANPGSSANAWVTPVAGVTHLSRTPEVAEATKEM